MGIENRGESAPGYNEAMARIAIIEQQAQQMGANDSESSDFRRIREQLEAGELTPQAAIAAAEGVLGSKMDYH